MPFHYNKMGSGDINSRYNDTFIRVDGKLFYVSEFNSRAFRGTLLGSGESITLGPDEYHRIDTKAPRIGYFNVNNSSFRAVRIPTRYYRQGLSNANVRLFGASDSFGSVMHSATFARGFDDMLEGRFPTAQEVIRSFSRSSRLAARAISKDFCIRRNTSRDTLDLKYLGDTVGKVTDNGIEVDDEHFYLRESIGELNV